MCVDSAVRALCSVNGAALPWNVHSRGKACPALEIQGSNAMGRSCLELLMLQPGELSTHLWQDQALSEPWLPAQ